ncbi:HlyD family secretion protein [Janthinobacterium sp. Mn2066]|uniref:HlyD family secretion protein n=1 Tax=Janthinobacterium sp. Mn2066 TaxID=3395264 RepID=UPI003BC3CCA5
MKSAYKNSNLEPEKSLFRSEIIAAQGSRGLGAIRVAQPISGWFIACIALVLTAILLSFVTLGSVTKKARVAGLTVPSSGSLSILAPNAGVLTRSFVKEGDRVKAGQPLFELSTERQGDGGEITELVSQQLAIRQQTIESERRVRISQTEEKRHAIDERIQNLRAETIQLEQEIGLANRRKSLAQKTVDNYQTLQNNGFVSSAQIQQRQEELIDIDSHLSTLVRTRVQLEASRLSMEADRKALSNSLSADLAQFESSAANLKQEIAENQNRKQNLIVASYAGTVTTLVYEQGQAVNTGQALATLIRNPNKRNLGDDLEVHLYTPSRTAGFVAPGQIVLLRYQSYPYQKFGLQRGMVTAVSKTPFAPSELPNNLASTILSNVQQSAIGTNTSEALYRVKVKIDKQSITAYGHEQLLKPGMTLDADIIQENRKIWEWIFDPILAIVR